MLHPISQPRTCYVQEMLKDREGPFIASSDYMHLVPEQIAKWVPGGLVTLGTDGFGRSDSREELRRSTSGDRRGAHCVRDAEHSVPPGIDHQGDHSEGLQGAGHRR